jgi:hypothetical protein
VGSVGLPGSSSLAWLPIASFTVPGPGRAGAARYWQSHCAPQLQYRRRPERGHEPDGWPTPDQSSDWLVSHSTHPRHRSFGGAHERGSRNTERGIKAQPALRQSVSAALM